MSEIQTKLNEYYHVDLAPLVDAFAQTRSETILPYYRGRKCTNARFVLSSTKPLLKCCTLTGALSPIGASESLANPRYVISGPTALERLACQTSKSSRF